MSDIPNSLGYTSIFAGFFLLSLIKGSDPWRIMVLVVGLLQIGLATFAFYIFTDLNNLFDILAKTDAINEATRAQAKAVAGLWVFAFPAVIGAIGANLITSWFLAKKPKDQDDNLGWHYQKPVRPVDSSTSHNEANPGVSPASKKTATAETNVRRLQSAKDVERDADALSGAYLMCLAIGCVFSLVSTNSRSRS